MERLRSVLREPGLVSALGHAAMTRLVRVYLRLYHRWRLTGSEHLPQRTPFVMVANHASHLDALILGAALPYRVRSLAFSVAAGDVFFTNPPRSLFSSILLNAVPIWRKKVTNHAIEELRLRLVNDTCGLILFPEGTRSRDGAMSQFKPGIGMLVAGTAVPVIPCFIFGAYLAFPSHASFPKPVPIEMRVGRPLNFEAVDNDRHGWTHVASRVEEAVRLLSTVTSSSL